MSTKILISMVLIMLYLLGGVVYLGTKGRFLVKIYHDLIGWHLPNYDKGIKRDRVNTYAICKHCGKEIMQDSQGNWF